MIYLAHNANSRVIHLEHEAVPDWPRCKRTHIGKRWTVIPYGAVVLCLLARTARMCAACEVYR